MFLFCFEDDVVGAWMDELEFEGAGESLVKGVGGLEAAVEHLRRVKFSGGAEFLEAH